MEFNKLTYGAQIYNSRFSPAALCSRRYYPQIRYLVLSVIYHIILDHGPHPPRSREKKDIRDVSTFTTQHVRAATRSIKCERQRRHVALATASLMLVENTMAVYPLRISNSVCPLRVSNVSDECTYNIQ